MSITVICLAPQAEVGDNLLERAYISKHLVTYFASLLPLSLPTALRNEMSKSDVFAL